MRLHLTRCRAIPTLNVALNANHASRSPLTHTSRMPLMPITPLVRVLPWPVSLRPPLLSNEACWRHYKCPHIPPHICDHKLLVQTQGDEARDEEHAGWHEAATDAAGKRALLDLTWALLDLTPRPPLGSLKPQSQPCPWPTLQSPQRGTRWRYTPWPSTSAGLAFPSRQRL